MTATTTTRRVALLGLLAELRGAGAVLAAPDEFTAGGLRRAAGERLAPDPPHAVKVVVDRPLAQALEVARTAAAAGLRLIFLLPHGRGREGGVAQEDVLGAITGLGHALALHVDLAALEEEPVAALAGLTRPYRTAGVPLRAAALRHDERHPFDAQALADADWLEAAGVEAGLRDWVDAVSASGGRRFTPAFAVAESGGRLLAASLDPPYEIHSSEPGEIDAVTVRALADTVARGSCVYELRLSSLTI